MKSNLFVAVKSGLSKHSPEILIGLGVAGLLGTTVLAVRETPKVLKLMESKKNELGIDKLTVKDTVKTVWKNYIPCAVLAVTSVACIVGASNISAEGTQLWQQHMLLVIRHFQTIKKRLLTCLVKRRIKK